ncbi:hypothetical protein ACFLQY_01925 [Verrucomicrobiota bacterium]
MTTLQMIGYIIGGLATFAGILMLTKPQAVLSKTDAFPRSKYPAWILTTINMIWAAWLCNQMYLGWFDPYKWIFYVAGGFGIVAIIRFLNELLAPRMLGAFLLLVASPCLRTARFFPTPMDPSPWRLVISVICYIWIIYGIYLLCCPWGFRRMNERWTKFDPNLKLGGFMKLAFGVALIAISALFYGN